MRSRVTEGNPTALVQFGSEVVPSIQRASLLLGARGGLSLAPFSDHFYAVMRIVIGFLFIQHGTQKLFEFPVDVPHGIPDFVLYIAGPIELLGGFLVMIGLMTSWSAFFCSGLMAAAYWSTHGLNAPLPIQNNGELSAVYCFVFLYIASKGSGIWSVDAARSVRA